MEIPAKENFSQRRWLLEGFLNFLWPEKVETKRRLLQRKIQIYLRCPETSLENMSDPQNIDGSLDLSTITLIFPEYQIKTIAPVLAQLCSVVVFSLTYCCTWNSLIFHLTQVLFL